MKKIFVSVVGVALVVPQMAMASWWNPVSWFTTKGENSSIGLGLSTTTNTLIVHDTESFKKNRNTAESVADTKRTSSVDDRTLLVKAEKEIEVLKGTILNLQKEINQLKGIKPNTKEVTKETLEEKVIHRDGLIEKSGSVPVSASVGGVDRGSTTVPVATAIDSPAIEYSNYNFNYKWSLDRSAYILSCPMTPRNIVVKRAVFKIPDSAIQTISTLRDLEAVGFKVNMNAVGLKSNFGNKSQSYSTEEVKMNTFEYFGGSIPICRDGRTIMVSNIGGSITDFDQGRKIKAHLDNRGIIVNATSTDGGVTFYLDESLIPIMPEWEIWDNTTNKPVKVK